MSYRQERTCRSGPVGTYLTSHRRGKNNNTNIVGGWVPHLAHGHKARPNPGQAVNDMEKQHRSRFQVCVRLGL